MQKWTNEYKSGINAKIIEIDDNMQKVQVNA